MSLKPKVWTFLFLSYFDYFRRMRLYISLNLLYSVLAFTILQSLGTIYWPEKIDNEGKFMFWCTFWTHQISYILGNGFFIILYYFDLMKECKFDKNPWPWQSDYPKWIKQLKKTIVTICINHFVLAPLISLPSLFSGKSPFRTDYETLPTVFEMFWQNLFSAFVDEFFFYWSHRALHWNKIYPYIHKKHHEYISTLGIAAEYAHPIEYVFGNVIPSSLGSLMLGKRMHGYTALVNIFRKILGTTEGHSGFEFKLNFLKIFSFFAPADYHASHHLNFKGNYGSSYIWDILFQTLNDTYLRKIIKEIKNCDYVDKSIRDTADNKNLPKSQNKIQTQ
jgi:methylsterol monooxygenase